MIKTIAAVLITSSLLTAPAPDPPQNEWKNLGECRITCYCPVCNDGQGHESSSGKELRYGHAACNWLPIGTKISIEGEIFEIVDTCGTDAIDIFVDTDDQSCRCNLNEYKDVRVKN